ncbi:MAG: hypothetical protein WCI74_19305 [Actinomycetes bacterium]
MADAKIWTPRDSRWPVRTWRDLISVPHRGFGDWRLAIRTGLAIGLAFLVAKHVGPDRIPFLAVLYAAQGSQLTGLGTFSAVTQQVLGAWCGLMLGVVGLLVFGSVTIPGVILVGGVAMLVAQFLPTGSVGKAQVLIMAAYVYCISGLIGNYGNAGWIALDVLLGAASAMILVLVWPSGFPIRHLEDACKALIEQIRAAISTTAIQLRDSAGTRLDIHEHHDFRATGNALVPTVRAGDMEAAFGRDAAVWNWRAQNRLSRLDRFEDKWDWLGSIQGPLRSLVNVIDELYDHSDRHPPLLDRAALVGILEETRSLFEVAAGTSHQGDIAKASQRLANKIDVARSDVLAGAPLGDVRDPMVVGSFGLLDRIDTLRGLITHVPH